MKMAYPFFIIRFIAKASFMFKVRRILAIFAIVLACLPATSGCKKGIKLVPVTGQVVWRKKGLEGAYVNFQSDDEQYLAFGLADSEGNFRMKTLSRDGVVPGRHRVWISKFLKRDLPQSTRKFPEGEGPSDEKITQFTMEEMYKDLAKKLASMKSETIEDRKAMAKAMQMPLAPSLIPVKYADPDTSKIEVEVYEDQENHFIFTILDPEEDPDEKAKLEESDGESKSLLIDSAAG